MGCGASSKSTAVVPESALAANKAAPAPTTASKSTAEVSGKGEKSEGSQEAAPAPEAEVAAGASPAGKDCFDAEDAVTAAPVGKDPSLGCKFRGVCVDFLCNGFLELLKTAGLDANTTTVVDAEKAVLTPAGKDMVCPIDQRPGAAYVHTLSGPDQAGMATHMLSYTWAYRIIDIVEALKEHCARQDPPLDTKRTYVWMCCMCINQHRVREMRDKGQVVPFAEFEEEFGERVKGITKVLALLTPWQSPTYVTRIWCVYELYVAEETEGIKYDIILPPMQEQEFFECLVHKGIQELWDALQEVRVEEAKASVEGDRANIMKLVEQGPGPDVLNSTVRRQIQHWFVTTATNHLDRKLSKADMTKEEADEVTKISANVLQYHIELGLYDTVQKYSEQTLKLREKVGNSDGIVSTLNNLALGLDSQGETERAKRIWQEVLKIDEETKGKRSAQYAITLNNIAGITESTDKSEACRMYEEVLEIHAEVSGATSEDYLIAKSNLAGLKRDQEEWDEAERLYREVLEATKAANREKSSSYATTLGNLALLVKEQGKISEAIKMYEEVLEIDAETVGVESDGYATDLSNLAVALAKDGKPESLERGAELLKKSLELKRQIQGEDSSAYAKTLELYAENLGEQGKLVEASEKYAEVLGILKETEGEDSSWYQTAAYNSANLKERQGLLEEALGLYEKAHSSRAVDKVRAKMG